MGSCCLTSGPVRQTWRFPVRRQLRESRSENQVRNEPSKTCFRSIVKKSHESLRITPCRTFRSKEPTLQTPDFWVSCSRRYASAPFKVPFQIIDMFYHGSCNVKLLPWYLGSLGIMHACFLHFYYWLPTVILAVVTLPRAQSTPHKDGTSNGRRKKRIAEISVQALSKIGFSENS